MQTDREMLELAARAAYESGRVVNRRAGRDLVEVLERADGSFWMPYLDDGDALRLAVIIPSLNLQWIIAEAWQAHNDHESRRGYVRRAIVRAAAEIGKASLSH